MQTSHRIPSDTANLATVHIILLQLVQQANSGTPLYPQALRSDAAPDMCILYSSAGQQPTLPNGPLELLLSPSRLTWPPGDRTPWWRPRAPGSCGVPRLPLPGDDSPGEPGRESSPKACPAGAMPPAGNSHQARSGTSIQGLAADGHDLGHARP